MAPSAPPRHDHHRQRSRGRVTPSWVPFPTCLCMLLCALLCSFHTSPGGHGAVAAAEEGDDEGDGISQGPYLKVSKVSKHLERARTGEDLRVDADISFRREGLGKDDPYLVSLHDRYVVTARIRYASMFGEERVADMRRVSDAKPSSWTGSIPAEDLPGYGQMVRYGVEATAVAREFPFDSLRDSKPKGDKKYATVVDLVAVADETSLPTLHWFVEDEAKAMWDEPVGCFLMFPENGPANKGGKLRFYDEVTVRRRGSGRRGQNAAANMWGKRGSKDWPKRKLKFDFDGTAFRVDWGDGQRRKVEEVNLHSGYDEPGPGKTYMREVLAASAFERVGVPAPAAKHVVLRRNGEFFGLYVAVENVDGEFLERKGESPSGPLFKAVHWRQSNLRPRAPAWAPCRYDAEWESDWGACPEVYRYSTSPKHLDEAGARDELDALLAALDAVNSRGDAAPMRAAVDTTLVTREMAVQTALLHQDRCTKNYYVYRSRWTNRWSRIPWDMEDSFATDYRNAAGRCDDDGGDACDWAQYCVQSCWKWNSPFFCDRDHPQDIFTESGGRSTWNHLVNGVLVDVDSRTAYFRELKRATESLHHSGWLEGEARRLRDVIASDARRDAAKWGLGDLDEGVNALVQQIRDRKQILKSNYGAWWRDL